PKQKRLIFCGQFLRNMRMVVRVTRRLAAAHKDLELHMVITDQAVKQTELGSLVSEPWVRLHVGIGDEELRELLATAYLMLIPFDLTGANNAIVEALASGLPIVTTDVGGIGDYGGGTIFPLVANNDDDAMVALVEDYFANARRRDE